MRGTNMGWLGDQKNRIQGLLNKLTNDAHVPIAIFVFLVTSAYHFHTGKDLGANYTSTIYALYGFLGGHALVYQKWPDKSDPDNANTNTNASDQTQTTDVNVTVAPPAAPAAAPAAPATGSNTAKG